DLYVTGVQTCALPICGDNNKIQGCYLGSNAIGNAVAGNSNTAALYLAGGSASNIIGVDGDGVNDAIEGNLLVGSSQMGVWLNGRSEERRVGKEGRCGG